MVDIVGILNEIDWINDHDALRQLRSDLATFRCLDPNRNYSNLCKE